MGDELGDATEKKKPGVVIFHGLSDEKAAFYMKLIKQSSGESKNFIFAMTTPHSLEWKVKDLISGLQAEHDHFKKDDSDKTI